MSPFLARAETCVIYAAGSFIIYDLMRYHREVMIVIFIVAQALMAVSMYVTIEKYLDFSKLKQKYLQATISNGTFAVIYFLT